MDSPHTDPELTDWIRWVEEGGKVPAFVRMVAEAALMACSPDYVLRRPVLLELKRQHPEPQPGPAALDDPELSHWLRWAWERGNTPAFVLAVAEAALIACSPDYVLLRPVLLELKRRYTGGWRSNLGVIGRHYRRGVPSPRARAVSARRRRAQPRTWQSAATARRILWAAGADPWVFWGLRQPADSRFRLPMFRTN